MPPLTAQIQVEDDLPYIAGIDYIPDCIGQMWYEKTFKDSDEAKEAVNLLTLYLKSKEYKIGHIKKILLGRSKDSNLNAILADTAIKQVIESAYHKKDRFTKNLIRQSRLFPGGPDCESCQAPDECEISARLTLQQSTMQEILAAIPDWIEAYHFKTTPETETIYRYTNGVYMDDGETLLKGLLEAHFKDAITNHMITEAVGHIKRRTYTSRERFNSAHVVNVKNGLLDLDTFKLQEHTPAIVSTVQLPIKYDAGAVAERIPQFFTEVLPGKDIPMIEEIAGWMLWPEYHIHKAIMLLGPGRNGKGTFLRLLRAFIGASNISSVTLQDLISNRFSRATLFGKMTNIGGDIPSTDLSDTAVFRMLTAQDSLEVEKKFKDSFRFNNRAKMIFSANNLPRTPDDTFAFYSRWVILEFTRTFLIEDGTADLNLDAKLQTETELSGLLNIALRGLQRLKEKGWKFSYDKTVDDVEIMYKRSSNPVLAFLMDECEADDDGMIEKNELYSRYKDYSHKRKLRPVTLTKFGMLLKDQTAIPLSDFRPWIEHGSAPRCWLGVRFKR
jgi:putative DNA primase/helicase